MYKCTIVQMVSQQNNLSSYTLTCLYNTTALQSQKAVTANFSSKQLLPFIFARKKTDPIRNCQYLRKITLIILIYSYLSNKSCFFIVYSPSKPIFIYPVVCYRQTPWYHVYVLWVQNPPLPCVIMNIHDARTPSFLYRPHTHLLSRSDW